MLTTWTPMVGLLSTMLPTMEILIQLRSSSRAMLMSMLIQTSKRLLCTLLLSTTITRSSNCFLLTRLRLSGWMNRSALPFTWLARKDTLIVLLYCLPMRPTSMLKTSDCGHHFTMLPIMVIRRYATTCSSGKQTRTSLEIWRTLRTRSLSTLAKTLKPKKDSNVSLLILNCFRHMESMQRWRAWLGKNPY